MAVSAPVIVICALLIRCRMIDVVLPFAAGSLPKALVIPARLRNQRLSALDDGGPAGSNGDLAVGGEQVRVLLGTARVMHDAISVHELADQRPVGDGLHANRRPQSG